MQVFAAGQIPSHAQQKGITSTAHAPLLIRSGFWTVATNSWWLLNGFCFFLLSSRWLLLFLSGLWMVDVNSHWAQASSGSGAILLFSPLSLCPTWDSNWGALLQASFATWQLSHVTSSAVFGFGRIEEHRVNSIFACTMPMALITNMRLERRVPGWSVPIQWQLHSTRHMPKALTHTSSAATLRPRPL